PLSGQRPPPGQRPSPGHGPAPGCPSPPGKAASASAPSPADPGAPPGWGEAVPRPDIALPRVQVSGPADILAVVPHLMGFHPWLSFVVIGAAGSRRRVELGFRYDLPDPPGAEAATAIADHAVAVLAQRGASTVIGIGYGPGRLVTPVADAFAAAVGRRRLQLRGLLRVEDG